MVRTRKANTLLLDGDLIAYRTSAAKEHSVHWGDGLWTLHSEEQECQLAAKQYIEHLQTLTGIDSVMIAHSSSVNFRKELNPMYKANRAETRKPLALKPLQEWLRSEYSSLAFPRLEADDVMGFSASQEGSMYVIISDDKDMLTIPSLHYDPDAREFLEIDLAEANFNFYCQALTGDATDNYKGVPNVGRKTAEKILAGCDFVKDEVGVWERVKAAYLKAGLTEDDALLNARMARILRHGEYDTTQSREILWNPPKP